MMATPWVMLALVAIGFAAGRLLRPGALRGRTATRIVGWAAGVAIAVPVVLILLAKLFQSDVLGWMFGLTFMAEFLLVPCGVLVAAGFLAGGWSKRRRADGSDDPEVDRPTHAIRIDRDCVHASDDGDARTIAVDDAATHFELFRQLRAAAYLPSIAGGRATWVIESSAAQPPEIGVWAQEWPEARLLVPDTDWPDDVAGAPVTLKFVYRTQEDPQRVFDDLVAARRPPVVPPVGLPHFGSGNAAQRRLAAPGIVTAMVAVLCGFIVLLGMAFKLHAQKPPDVIARTFVPSIVLLGAIVVLVARRGFVGGPGSAPGGAFNGSGLRRRMRRDRLAGDAERRARVAALASDPVTRHYAARIEAGEPWSDAQIAYDLDPDALSTCRHLQPLEREMRRVGVRVRLQTVPQVRADCRVDERRLGNGFDLPPSVAYREVLLGGRAAEEDPQAFIGCSLCQASIHVVHPRDATATTTWFPGPRDGHDPIGA